MIFTSPERLKPLDHFTRTTLPNIFASLHAQQISPARAVNHSNRETTSLLPTLHTYENQCHVLKSASEDLVTSDLGGVTRRVTATSGDSWEGTPVHKYNLN